LFNGFSFAEKCDDADFVRYNGSCYKVEKTAMTFYQAQKNCREDDAELASIHSQLENIFISDVIPISHLPL
jgi:hypothetical protein